MAQAGAVAAITGQDRPGERAPRAFNADERSGRRHGTPVVIGDVTFKRTVKVWNINLAMRRAMRDQETAVARSERIRARVTELEVEQIVAAQKGDTDREEELETEIVALVAKADESSVVAEIVSYRLLALLLEPPQKVEQTEGGAATTVPHDDLGGFGLIDDPQDAAPAIAWLQKHIDIEDATALAEELSGSVPPDPPTTSSSETGST